MVVFGLSRMARAHLHCCASTNAIPYTQPPNTTHAPRNAARRRPRYATPDVWAPERLLSEPLVHDAVLLVLTGEPLSEPVVGYGPFVMTSDAEIRQAITDFNSGKFGSA